MKKQIILSGVIGILVVVGIAMLYTSPKNMIARQLHIEIPIAENVEYTDDHGGWFGEGAAFGKLKLDGTNGQAFLEKVQKDETWSKLPITENLKLLMYGGEKDGVTYTDEFAHRFEIPETTNGYFYFLDRLNSSHSDENLLDGSALNFTFSLYDVDNNTLYFLKVDT